MAYSYYTPLTVTSNTALLAATLANKDVLVKFTDNRLKTIANGGHVANANGYDINFYSDITHLTPLTWELFYDGTAGTVVAWVKIPSCAVSTVFYMFYGDSSITTFQSTASSVWDSDYKGIWHGGDGTTISLADSTSNANNATNTSVTEGSGKIHGAFVFSGATARSRLTITGITSTTTVTISAWVNASGSGGDTYGAIVQNSAGNQGFFLPIQSQLKVGTYYSATNHFGNTIIGVATWTHIALVVTAGAVVMYVNGVAEASTYTSFPSFTIGVLGGGDSSAQNNFAGSIEEIRISTVARSANWLLADYNNQNAPSTFVTLGTEVAGSGFLFSLTDNLNIRDAIQLVGGDPFYHIQFSEALQLQDQLQPLVPRIAKLLSDTINNLVDSYSGFLGIPVKAFDSQQFNWDEALATRILVVLKQSPADSINNLSDSASVVRRNVVISVALADTLHALSDAIRMYNTLIVATGDNFIISDSLRVRFNNLLKIAEGLTPLLEGLGIRIAARPTFADTLSLTDSANTSLRVHQSITKSDTLSLADHVTTQIAGNYQENGFLQRIRRYLNDL